MTFKEINNAEEGEEPIVDKEILLHIGVAETNEENLFTRKQFNYHSSKQRKIESDLL